MNRWLFHNLCFKCKNWSNFQRIVSNKFTWIACELLRLAVLIETPGLCPWALGKSRSSGFYWQPRCEVQLVWGFLPKNKFFYGKVFYPTVAPQPLFRWNLFNVEIILMLQFVLNKVGQIFRWMFMSGASNGSSCETKGHHCPGKEITSS